MKTCLLFIALVFAPTILLAQEDDGLTISVEQSPEWHSVPVEQVQAPVEKKHHWYKDWRNWVIIGVAVGTSGFATREIHNCRARNDLIHCPDGGYGEFRAREELRLGSSLTMAALSIYGREHWHGHWYDEFINNAPVTLWSGYNMKVGFADRNVPTFPKMDLHNIQIKH